MEMLDKIGVIYWSNRESTEIMAEKISNGIDGAGAKAILLHVGDFDLKTTQSYAKIVLGCPELEGEALNKNDFEPFFLSIEEHLKGKKIALFGSHEHEDDHWMTDWENCVKDLGGILFDKGLAILGDPDRQARRQCVEFGEEFARF